MIKIVSLWLWFACFLVWALVSGCSHLPVGGDLFPVPFPRVDIPHPETPPPDEGWCEEAKPVGPGSDVDCVGILVPPHRLGLLMTEADLLVQTRKVIASAYQGRDADREYAASIVAARDEQIRLAREKQPKLLGLGVGIGVGSTLAVVLTAVLARPPQ